jgi:hypothetical protein
MPVIYWDPGVVLYRLRVAQNGQSQHFGNTCGKSLKRIEV